MSVDFATYTVDFIQTEWVLPAITELMANASSPAADATPLSSETVLFGRTGLLSSIQLVMLTVALEQQIEDVTGQSLVLADEKAMSERNSPFKTVGSLSGFIATRLGA